MPELDLKFPHVVWQGRDAVSNYNFRVVATSANSDPLDVSLHAELMRGRDLMGAVAWSRDGIDAIEARLLATAVYAKTIGLPMGKLE